MQAVGVICEYNPFHLGHFRQFSVIRQAFGEDVAIVCLMSGNFVQRGQPAIFDKTVRAKAAVMSGADLVLELPVTSVLSSAEGFARGGVEILDGICQTLCFGSETGDKAALMHTAGLLESPEFSNLLKAELAKGVSFPAARGAAVAAMGEDPEILRRPNDILAVEYCKAILHRGSSMDIFPVHRPGDYHALQPDDAAPSAAAVRHCIQSGAPWLEYIPEAARPVLASAPVHTLRAGERAVLARLRTMEEAEFAALPGGSEGLWRKFMHACRREDTLEAVLTATKSKRYTRSRLDRMALCAFLGLTEDDLKCSSPYVRVLAFSGRGRELLHEKKKGEPRFLMAGEKSRHPYWTMEARCADLYGLFATDKLEPPGAEGRYRVFYQI